MVIQFIELRNELLTLVYVDMPSLNLILDILLV